MKTNTKLAATLGYASALAYQLKLKSIEEFGRLGHHGPESELEEAILLALSLLEKEGEE